MRMGIAMSLILVLPGTLALAGEPGDQRLLRGRELTSLFYEGRIDSLWQRFAPPMRELLRDPEGLRAFWEQAGAQLGREVSVISESVDLAGGDQVYARVAQFEKPADPILVQWAWDAQQRVTSFLVTASRTAPSDYLEYRTRTELRLPFQGAWYVFWGGRELPQNRHASAKDQRFAYDFVILENGSSHSGEGTRNEDYHCFGQPILAPGPVVVRAVADGIEDNVPGVMNPREPMGNHVILDHGGGEFSFLAHFRRGSVQVRVGDRVAAGGLLGTCGNSGNSSEPHLHYHLQNTVEPFGGSGLPAQFIGYIADGLPVERGEPERGQLVRAR
jgi:murein DD-endopeptidase MepM/ murein hydrolase activator NlpD